jgi:hypothetical protein
MAGCKRFAAAVRLGIAMRKTLPFFTAVLLAGLSASAVNAQSSADTEICAAEDKAAYSPEQRIAACTTLVETFKDQQK